MAWAHLRGGLDSSKPAGGEGGLDSTEPATLSLPMYVGANLLGHGSPALTIILLCP